MSPIREEKREQVLSTYYFDVDRVNLSNKEIGQFERYIVRENDGDTVCVLPVTENQEVVFIEQYRVPNHSWTLELPAGHATDPHQHPEEIAEMKLEEEAGYQASDFSQVVRFVNTPSFSTQHTVAGARATIPCAGRPRPGVPLLQHPRDPFGQGL